MKTLLLSIIILLTFTSCSFIDLRNDLKKQDKLSIIEVNLDVKLKEGAQVVIALVDVNKSSIINYRVVKEQRKVEFIVGPSTYKIYAFEDLDLNYKYSINERTVGSENIIIDDTRHHEKLNLSIVRAINKDEVNYISTLVKSLKLNINNASLHNGTIVPTTSDIFSDENIHKGMWQPLKFVFEVPFGIFLEKEYDPNKKVVLFVHGISGAPKNFTYLVENLDKTKYQAMYAYYPSGISIFTVSKYLARVMSEFKIKYDFENIAVIAHSMGGLVSRNMLNELSENHDFVDTFITISSPLDGDKRANYGVKNSPIVMPVWKDMAYKSEFSSQLYTRPLSEKINYYLVFGVKSKSNDDGVVSIPSQLRLEAQKEAKIVRGYNETHMSILSSKEVSTYIYNILDANY